MKLYTYSSKNTENSEKDYIFINYQKKRIMGYYFNYNYMIIYFPCFSLYNKISRVPLYISNNKTDKEISENFSIFLKNLNKFKNETV